MSSEVTSDFGARIVEAFKAQQKQDRLSRIAWYQELEGVTPGSKLPCRVSKKDQDRAVAYAESLYRDFSISTLRDQFVLDQPKTDPAPSKDADALQEAFLMEIEQPRGGQRLIAALPRVLYSSKVREQASILTGVLMFGIGLGNSGNVERGIAFACLGIGVSFAADWIARRKSKISSQDANFEV